MPTIRLSPIDNVVVARQNLQSGNSLLEDIPAGHKVAAVDIPKGSAVIKYGQSIGKASRAIRAGEWVHTHNLEPRDAGENPEFAVEQPQPPELPPGLPRSFSGYLRPDGRVGTRNYVAVVPVSNCASHVASRIASEFSGLRDAGIDGVFAVPHPEGCGHHEGPDTVQLERTLKGIAGHPNVGAVLFVGLGCEVNSLSKYESFRERPAATLEIQSAGGSTRSVSEGKRVIRKLMETAGSTPRSEVPAACLAVGLKCGGSDAFSGISANPALGFASDLVVAAGGTVVLAEIPEIFGAEHLLTRRAVDRKTGEDLIRCLRWFQEYAGLFGATLNSNPAPGNIEGGISNIVEKSLGAIMKGGSTMLTGVVGFAERISGKGLMVMNTPGYDPVSLTGLAAGGCNVAVFTTGRGTPMGSPVIPVLKVATNSRIYRSMQENMDINAGEIIDGVSDIRHKGTEIYLGILRAASGELTRSELLGHQEFVPWRIGPVM
jgi:altronate hydrolase